MDRNDKVFRLIRARFQYCSAQHLLAGGIRDILTLGQDKAMTYEERGFSMGQGNKEGAYLTAEARVGDLS